MKKNFFLMYSRFMYYNYNYNFIVIIMCTNQSLKKTLWQLKRARFWVKATSSNPDMISYQGQKCHKFAVIPLFNKTKIHCSIHCNQNSVFLFSLKCYLKNFWQCSFMCVKWFTIWSNSLMLIFFFFFKIH